MRLRSLPNTQKAIIALIIANIIWGAASPIFKWSLQNIQPFTLAFLRFDLAALLLFPFAHKKIAREKGDPMKLFLLSFIGITVGISLFFIGLKETTSINVPIIASAGPVFLVFFSWLVLKEKIKVRVVGGSLIALAGVTVIILQPLLKQGIDGSLLGNMFILGSTIAGVVYAILAKEEVKNYSPETITFWSFGIGALGFAPFALYEAIYLHSMQTINLQGLSGIAFGTLLSSAAAYYLFHWALKYLPASETGLFSYLDPFAAIIIAVPLLGEVPTIYYLLGSVLVFFGIYISEGRLPYHPIHKLKEAN